MSAFIPPAINQFNQPNGKTWPATEWPDGTKKVYTGNCGPTSAAWLTAFATRGRVNRTPPEVRFMTRIRAQPVPFDTLARVVKTLIGDRAQMRKPLRTARMLELLERDGIAIGLATDYELFKGSSSFLPTFDEGHFLVAIGGTIMARTIDVMDPIGERQANGKRQGAIHGVKLSQLIEASETYAQQHGSPSGTVHAIVVRQERAPKPPTPPPADPKDAEIARLRDALEAAEDENADLEAELSEEEELLTQIHTLSGGLA